MSRNYNKKKGYSKSGPDKRNSRRETRVSGRQAEPKELEQCMSGRQALDAIKSNDISWYNRSPLYPLAVRVPFNQIMGANPERQYPGYYSDSASMPGVMTIDFAPTIGWASDMNSAVNRAFNQLYSDIVSKTSGALQMQQMDLAIMTMGVASIACHLGYAKKIMHSYQAYSSLNYYLPRALIYDMGIDFEDLVSGAADYQIKLTDLITRFNRLAIPNFSDVHVRQYALSHNLYTDSETVFGQLINFRPNVLYVFNDEDHSLRAQEIWTLSNTNKWAVLTFGDYLDAILSALQKWENSSVTPIVAGNVRRAYPESALVKIDGFVPNTPFSAVVDRNITWQVNNMRWNTVDLSSLDITQDPVGNILVCKPLWVFQDLDTARIVQDSKYHLLNSYDGNTSEEFIMEATRLIPTISFAISEGDHVYTAELVNCPSELVTRVTVFTRYMHEDGTAEQMPLTLASSEVAIPESQGFDYVADFLNYITTLIKWRNGPGVVTHFYRGTMPDIEMVNPQPYDSREIGLYTHLHQDQLDALHLAASQSLYWANDYKVGK